MVQPTLFQSYQRRVFLSRFRTFFPRPVQDDSQVRPVLGIRKNAMPTQLAASRSAACQRARLVDACQVRSSRETRCGAPAAKDCMRGPSGIVAGRRDNVQQGAGRSRVWLEHPAIPDGVKLGPGATDDSIWGDQDDRTDGNSRDAIVTRFDEDQVRGDLEPAGLRPRGQPAG